MNTPEEIDRALQLRKAFDSEIVRESAMADASARGLLFRIVGWTAGTDSKFSDALKAFLESCK